jgi:hypothetical protein
MKARKLIVAAVTVALVILGSGAANALPLLRPNW